MQSATVEYLSVLLSEAVYCLWIQQEIKLGLLGSISGLPLTHDKILGKSFNINKLQFTELKYRTWVQ